MVEFVSHNRLRNPIQFNKFDDFIFFTVLNSMECYPSFMEINYMDFPLYVSVERDLKSKFSTIRNLLSILFSGA